MHGEKGIQVSGDYVKKRRKVSLCNMELKNFRISSEKTESGNKEIKKTEEKNKNIRPNRKKAERGGGGGGEKNLGEKKS